MAEVLRNLTPLTSIQPSPEDDDFALLSEALDKNHLDKDLYNDQSRPSSSSYRRGTLAGLPSPRSLQTTPTSTSPTFPFPSNKTDQTFSTSSAPTPPSSTGAGGTHSRLASPSPPQAYSGSADGSPIPAVMSAAEHADNKQAWDVVPTRNLIVRNVREDVQLMQIGKIFEPYGPLRHIFRPPRTHGVVVVMFYDLGNAFIAHHSTQQHTLADQALDVTFAGLETMLQCVVHDGTQVDEFLIGCLANQGEILVQVCAGDGAGVLENLKTFGSIRSVRQCEGSHAYIVEYYDIRAAEKAVTELVGSNLNTGLRAMLFLPKTQDRVPSVPATEAYTLHIPTTRQRPSTSPFDYGETTRSAKRVQLDSPYHSWDSIFAESSLHSFTSPSYQSQPYTSHAGSRAPNHNSNNDSQDTMCSPDVHYSSTHREPLRINTSFLQKYGAEMTNTPSSAPYNRLAAHNENDSPWKVSTPLSAPMGWEDWISQRSPLSDLSSQGGVDSGRSLYDYSRLLGGQGDVSLSAGSCGEKLLKSARSDPSLRGSAMVSWRSGSVTPDGFGGGGGGGLKTMIGGLPKQAAGKNEANVYDIVMGKDKRTTFMIRNIPNKYTQQMLIDFLNETHKGQYDFLYLRMDFKNHCNVGYAFINFVGAAAIISFIERAVGKRWAKFNSDKICTLSYANIQGREGLVEKFRNSSVMLEHETYRPKIFYTSGPLKGEEEPFPPPTTKIRKSSGSDVLYSRDNAWSHLRYPTPCSPSPGASPSYGAGGIYRSYGEVGAYGEGDEGGAEERWVWGSGIGRV
ncbi:hypothetical protein HK097_007505 [Rhizophlyctis rosea]|uniref:RRM domain-containing protein n=1 Tax=Rhizophlyctis rosea TaxID=64517 RepID=A0AAD5X5V6_9FUNG|nr:hypothetical protein HK097_007505 [Rhizophlyctis rosea]